MAIVRAPRPRRDFTELANATIRDIRLSYRARGILVRLLSNEDGYRMTATDLAREGKEGRDAVLTAMRELRSVGYMVTKRFQVKGGLWKTETWVYDTPQVFTEVGKPDSGIPGVGLPIAIKKTHKKKQQNPTPQSPLPISRESGQVCARQLEGGGGSEDPGRILDSEIEQDVMDELQGRSEAVERGEAPPIWQPEKWLASLRKSAADGKVILSVYGRKVRSRRAAEARLEVQRRVSPALSAEAQSKGMDLLRRVRSRALGENGLDQEETPVET